MLAIGGSDPSGGAGIQADIKTITALGGYAAAAITAVTVQDTRVVTLSHAIPAPIVGMQVLAVLSDIGADAIKTGTLSDAETVEEVIEVLTYSSIPLVVDPVMVATAGMRLLETEGVEPLRRLIGMATLVTPNASEAATFTGLAVETTDDLRRAGEKLLETGARAALMTGGHIPGANVVDLLLTPAGETLFEGPRMETRHTHGTGCTLASACATGLAQGMKLEAAVARAWAYTAEAIRRAPGFGAGHGPLDHAWPVRDR